MDIETLNTYYDTFKLDRIFHKLKEEAIIPVYIHEDDSGMDLYSCINNPITIQSWSVGVVPTGLTCTLPVQTELQLRSRSGLAYKNRVFVLNSPGTVDEGYVRTEEEDAEIKVILANFSDKPYVVENHTRIAQAVLASVLKVRMPDDHVYKVRAGKGMGSTGVK